jgi:hypothetical protein
MDNIKQQAKDWVTKNVVLAEHCGVEYSDLEESLEELLKGVALEAKYPLGGTECTS